MTQNRSTEITSSQPDAAFQQQQRRRMLIALGVLVLALISVLIKDRQFWFPPSPSADADVLDQPPPRIMIVTKPATPNPPPAIVTRKPVHAAVKSKRAAKADAPAATDSDAGAVITATNRAVLPPLEVEVVGGNQHRTINPGDSSVKLDMESGGSAAPEPAQSSEPVADRTPLPPNAAARVELSPGTAQVVSRPVDPNYPLLAKQMKVQGAVVLQALISKTGSIQDIQVLSGPAILSAAAREAVSQWHFKPYYQSGRAVETEARITVNFTISTY
jgi:protein TonB